MRHRWLIFASWFAAATPALADITATYSLSDGRLPDMVIRVNDRGDSRIRTGNQMAVLTVGGETYVVMGDLDGVFAVRQSDLIAAFTAILPDQFGEQALESGSTDAPPYEIVETGSEAVGGRDGVVLSVRREGQDDGIASRYVVSRDPELAPLGSVIARQFSASTQPIRSIPGLAHAGADMADVLSRGTLIRLGHLLSLKTVDTSPIPSSEFDLPEHVLTREQFVARIGWPTSR